MNTVAGMAASGDVLALVRNSALAVELTGDQCAVLARLISVRDQADGEWINLHLLTRGDLAGELGFMDGRPHHAALRATGATRVLCLSRELL